MKQGQEMEENTFPQDEHFDDALPADDGMLPHSTEAEEAVLGAILINPDAYNEVGQIISRKDFFIRKHQWLWDAFTALSDSEQPVDVQTVAEELDRHDHLQDIGGKVFLYSLTGKTPSSMHAEAYASIVAEKSVRRRLIEAADKMTELAMDQKQPLDNVLDSAEQAIFDVSEKRDRKEVQPISSVVGEIYDKVRLLYQQGDELVGVPSGLRDLDKLTGGFQKSDLIIVAGRPGMGKTGFLLTVLKNVALQSKKHVAMFSLEMSNEQLVHRLIAQKTGINTQKIRTGKLSKDELPMFVEAIDVFGSTTVFLDDTPAITPLQLRTKCRRLHLEHHLDLIIIDYLQLMSSENGKDNNRVQEVSYISRNLKILARELNIPVLTAAQLSRGVEQRSDKTPVLSDLRESGSLEQDADIVMFLHNPASDKNNGEQEALDGAMKLIVAKHRNGPVGDIDLVFMKKLARFESAALARDTGGVV